MKKKIINRVSMLALLSLVPVTDALAIEGYTYIQSSLAFPWFMFFVFFALILIPFFMVIYIAWRKSEVTESRPTDGVVLRPSSRIVTREKGLFNRIVLPAILGLVAVFSILLVLNAYQAMDLMEEFGTAAPTMLNARP